MNTSPLYSPINSPLEIGMVVMTPSPLFGKGCRVRYGGRDCRAGVSIGTNDDDDEDCTELLFSIVSGVLCDVVSNGGGCC